MLLLRWLWIGNGNDGEIPPVAVFWTLRVLMFVLSFVLEDWALHELVQSPRHRRVAVLLVASSYVTWTYQTHTFSNSIETLAVAWSLVLIHRIVENKVCLSFGVLDLSLTSVPQRSSAFASAILAFVVVFGIFNRITFPAFLLIPGLRLIPHFIKKYDPRPYRKGLANRFQAFRSSSCCTLSCPHDFCRSLPRHEILHRSLCHLVLPLLPSDYHTPQ